MDILTIHLTSTSVKRVCDISRLKIAGTCWNLENADTQCHQLELINLGGVDTQEVQQFQQQQTLQPECQEQEMVENLGMRLRRKTIESWMKKNKSEKRNGTNLESQNPVLVVLAEGQQKRTEVLRAADLCIKREEPHQNNLRRSGLNQRVETQEVHQTGLVLTLVKYYDLLKSQRFQQQDTLSGNCT